MVEKKFMTPDEKILFDERIKRLSEDKLAYVYASALVKAFVKLDNSDDIDDMDKVIKDLDEMRTIVNLQEWRESRYDLNKKQQLRFVELIQERNNYSKLTAEWFKEHISRDHFHIIEKSIEKLSIFITRVVAEIPDYIDLTGNKRKEKLIASVRDYYDSLYQDGKENNYIKVDFQIVEMDGVDDQLKKIANSLFDFIITLLKTKKF